MVMDKLISDMVEQIVRTCNPIRVMLFGSVAKGEMRPDSDIDLLVIQNTDVPRAYRAAALKPFFLESVVPVDVVVMTEAEFAEESVRPYSFAHSAATSAIVLYEKGRAMNEQ